LKGNRASTGFFVVTLWLTGGRIRMLLGSCSPVD
jgi:hypothetical protein